MESSLSFKDGDPTFKDGKKIIRINNEFSGKNPIKSYKSKNKLVLYPGHERRADLIFGQSGSGKSWFSANSIIKPYQQKYRDNPIYLISPKDDDKVINDLGVIQIRIDEENFIEDPIDLDELGNAETGEGSLVLFDDCESIQNHVLRKAVDAFRDNILVRGRSMNISCVVITHLGTGGNATRILLNEVKTFTFFPGRSAPKAIRYVLETYAGLEKKEIEKIINIKGTRSVTYSKTYPNWIMTDNNIRLL
jgi:hypothetical protein